MVNPVLLSAIEAMTLDERLDLVDYIESTVDGADLALTSEQRNLVEARAVELDEDPSIGLTWDELTARVAARRT